MSKREALQILMKSPFFFRMSTTERKKLIAEFVERTAKKYVGAGDGFVLGND